MKVKVRGLVFVGFAAAVFAQSAMADITPAAADKKVVASKYYVDDVFQPNADRVTAAPEAGSNDWNSTDKYPSMAVLKAVKDTLDDINVVEGSTGYVDVTESSTGTFTVDLVPGQVTSSVDASNTSSTKLVTEGAVANYAQDKSKFDDATYDSTNQTYTSTIGASSANDEYPSSRNVYEFVTSQVSGAAYQPKDDTQATASSVRVGYNSDGNTPGWGSLAGASGGYVAISGSNGVYTVDIDSANKVSDQITSSSDASTKLATENAVYDYAEAQANKLLSTTPISSASTDVQYPSAKNVYDFVSTGYQPIAPAGVKVGNNGGWNTLSVDTTYLGLDTTTNPGTVQVTVNTATASAGISGASASNSTGANNLTTAYAVNAYVQSVLHGNEIPAMPEACTTAATQGHYCALVYGNRAAQGETADYGLEWTVMAPQN